MKPTATQQWTMSEKTTTFSIYGRKRRSPHGSKVTLVDVQSRCHSTVTKTFRARLSVYVLHLSLSVWENKLIRGLMRSGHGAHAASWEGGLRGSKRARFSQDACATLQPLSSRQQGNLRWRPANPAPPPPPLHHR